jgi:cytochrome b subunit of formate dehydrogenase
MNKIQEADRGLLAPRLHRLYVYRHTLMTRLTHWINLICIAVLLMSALQIFNAHPALYWGASRL